MGKLTAVIAGLWVLSCSDVFAQDVKEYEYMTKVAPTVQKQELLVREEPTDTPEIRELRRNLKKSIDGYRARINQLREKYGPWIETEHKAQELQGDIKRAQDTEYAKIIALYVQLAFYEMKNFYLEPHGSKGDVSRMLEGGTQQVIEYGIETNGHEIESKLMRKHMIDIGLDPDAEENAPNPVRESHGSTH